MYRGGIVELGPTQAVLDDPKHPYTQLLVSSDMSMFHDASEDGFEKHDIDAENHPLASEEGCPFMHRCVKATDSCRVGEVSLHSLGERQVACRLLSDQRPT
jgi:oligopeptide/dipeptide ABC transporter ATP-binding protein